MTSGPVTIVKSFSEPLQNPEVPEHSARKFTVHHCYTQLIPAFIETKPTYQVGELELKTVLEQMDGPNEFQERMPLLTQLFSAREGDCSKRFLMDFAYPLDIVAIQYTEAKYLGCTISGTQQYPTKAAPKGFLDYAWVFKYKQIEKVLVAVELKATGSLNLDGFRSGACTKEQYNAKLKEAKHCHNATLLEGNAEAVSFQVSKYSQHTKHIFVHDLLSTIHFNFDKPSVRGTLFDNTKKKNPLLSRAQALCTLLEEIDKFAEENGVSRRRGGKRKRSMK